jgi:hypothetical protein
MVARMVTAAIVSKTTLNKIIGATRRRNLRSNGTEMLIP